MTQSILELAHDLMSSPWIYVALFAFAALDAFAPIVPSESLVITAGVFAASGEPNLLAVVAVAALGAIAGDHVSYAIGRRAEATVLRRLRPGTKRHRTYVWAQRRLVERGGLLLVAARYVPGGRTAVTLTMGAVRYRMRSFAFFTVIAGVSWGIYSALVGYVGGKAFEQDPLKGVVLGIGIALMVTVAVEYLRHLRKRTAAEPARGSAARIDARPSNHPEPMLACVGTANERGETR